MLVTESITTLESVLDLAVWLEKHGEDFYERACAGVVDDGLKETFSVLANEERKHRAIYTDLYEMYTGKSAAGDELLGEYGRFIHLLIKEVAEVLNFAEMLSQDELIARALQFEKNTLLFFAEVKPLFRGKAGSIIDAICREEKRHIQKLLESKELLSGAVGGC